MASALLSKVKFALSALILIVIALWFWRRGIWPHELDARRSGGLLLLVSTSVFATAGLLRLINALLGEDVWETEPQFINQRYGQTLFPEEFPRGLKSFVTLVVVGAALGFFVAWLCEATYASRATLPTSDTTLIARSGDIAFDLYALVLVWLFATSLPHLLFSLGRICVSVAGELSDHVLGDRFPVIRVLRASRILSATTSHDQKVAAIAVLAAIPEPLAEKTLVDALERIDDGRIHAVISTTLRKRDWSPSTPLQWKRVALSAPTGDPACIQALVDLLRDPDPNIHQQASRLLDSLGWSPATSEELVWFLLARSQGEPDYMSIANEGQAAIRALCDVLDGSFPGNKDKSLSALMKIGGERVGQILVERASIGKNELFRNAIVERLSRSREASAWQLLLKIFEADLAESHVDQRIANELESQSQQSPPFRHNVSMTLSNAILSARHEGIEKLLADILMRIDRSAWNRVCQEARNRKRSWTAPSPDQLRVFEEQITKFVKSGRDQDRIQAGRAMEDFITHYAAWIPATNLKRLANLQIRLAHTSQIPIFERNDDGCDVQVGSTPSTTIYDSGLLKQLARQELIRRGNSA